MDTETAINFINDRLVIPPGWSMFASELVNDFGPRFENTICVDVAYPAFQTAIANLAGRQWINTDEIIQVAKFPLQVGDLKNGRALIGRILTDIVACINMHEAREIYRMAPTGEAPYHPHKLEGMKRWHKLTGESMRDDYTFGIA